LLCEAAGDGRDEIRLRDEERCDEEVASLDRDPPAAAEGREHLIDVATAPAERRDEHVAELGETTERQATADDRMIAANDTDEVLVEELRDRKALGTVTLPTIAKST